MLTVTKLFSPLLPMQGASFFFAPTGKATFEEHLWGAIASSSSFKHYAI
jgi:hypothetical protein